MKRDREMEVLNIKLLMMEQQKLMLELKISMYEHSDELRKIIDSK